MKPFTSCPGCQSSLYDYKYNDKWYGQGCAKRCDLQFHQHFKCLPQEATEIDYYQLTLKRFYMYVYLNCYGYVNQTFVYSNAELKKYGIASPIMKLPYANLDLSDFQKLDEKLHLLVLFS